jgi:hypothetical protein
MYHRLSLFAYVCTLCIGIVCVVALDADAFDTIILRTIQQSPDVPVTQRDIALLRMATKVGLFNGENFFKNLFFLPVP